MKPIYVSPNISPIGEVINLNDLNGFIRPNLAYQLITIIDGNQPNFESVSGENLRRTIEAHLNNLSLTSMRINPDSTHLLDRGETKMTTLKKGQRISDMAKGLVPGGYYTFRLASHDKDVGPMFLGKDACAVLINRDLQAVSFGLEPYYNNENGAQEEIEFVGPYRYNGDMTPRR